MNAFWLKGKKLPPHFQSHYRRDTCPYSILGPPQMLLGAISVDAYCIHQAAWSLWVQRIPQNVRDPPLGSHQSWTRREDGEIRTICLSHDSVHGYLFSNLQRHCAVILAMKDEDGGRQEFYTRNRQKKSIQFKNYTLGLLLLLQVKALPKHQVCPNTRILFPSLPGITTSYITNFTQ